MPGGCSWKEGELALNRSEHFGTLQARKQLAFLRLFPIASSHTNHLKHKLCTDPVHNELCMMRHGIISGPAALTQPTPSPLIVIIAARLVNFSSHSILAT
jgi:hypothetical protein